MTASAAIEADSVQPVASRVAGSAIALVIRRALVLLTGAGSTIVMARELNPAGFGNLQSALAVWAILLAVADLGFGLTMSRDLALPGAPRKQLLRTTYQVQGMWAVTVALAFAGTGLATGLSQSRGLLYLVLAPSLAATAFSAGRVYHLALFETSRLVVIDVTVALSQLIVVLVLAGLGAGPVALAIALSTGTTVNACWVGFVARRHAHILDPTRTELAAGARQQLFRRVLPLGLMGILSKVYLSIDLALLGWLITGNGLGEYAGAVKIVNMLNTVPGLVMGAALPGLAAVRSNRGELIALAARLAHWLTAAVLPLFLAVAIFAALVSRLVLGNAYAGAANLIVVLALSGIVAVASQYLGTVLIAADVVRPMLWQNAFAVVVNVAGNLALVPSFGAMAAAWLTVATECLICGMSLWTIRRVLPLRAMLSESRAGLLVVAMAAVVGLLLRPWPAPALAVATAVFLLGMWRTKAWPVELNPNVIFRRRAR